MDERCIPLKCLVIFIFLLFDHRFAVSIAVDRFKKDNHTTEEPRKPHHDHKASSSSYRLYNMPPLFSNGDRLKTMYTNLGSANNQAQLKYITGTGLLLPLIIRASDLGMVPDAQLNGMPDFLGDLNSLNQHQNQFSMLRPSNIDEHHHQLYHQADPFASLDGDAIMQMKRPKKKRKKTIFKFSDQDSMEFNKPSSMEFGQHNSMEFAGLNLSPPKKEANFEKSYDELVNSAKKLADTIENISENEESNLEGDLRDKKLPPNFESDSKFNFDDEMRLSHKDEDELDNLEKLENLSGFEGGQSGGILEGTLDHKKSVHSDHFNGFEKNSFSSDTEKFSEAFNEKFGDFFNQKGGNNDDEDKLDENYDKLYDKIIDNISNISKKKDKKRNKYSSSSDGGLGGDSTKPNSSNKKKPKKKPSDDEDDTGGQFANDNTSDEAIPNKDQDEIKVTNENEQNTSGGHTETGDYDYAGYAKDPNEPNEEVADTDGEKLNSDKPVDENGPNDGKYDDSNNKYQDDQQTTNPPSENDYKGQQLPPLSQQQQSTARRELAL